MTPQDTVERALALSKADGCVVVTTERSEANLRWAGNTLTTNGTMRSRSVAVISVIGEAAGVVQRSAVDADGLEKVFSVLRAPHTEEPTNWSRRYKANLEKLHSGNVMKVAEVVRDLWRRERERGLSAGEKRMLAKARQILTSELALAERVDEAKAEILLDEVLAS